MIGHETTLLSAYGLMIVALILLQTVLAVRQFGLKYMLGPRDDRLRLVGMAARADRAVWNCVVSMALFAPAVLAVQVQGLNSAVTLLAAQAFVLSRAVYVACYLTGVRWVRTLTFVIGLSATVILYYVAL